jgi:hypothetical protein
MVESILKLNVMTKNIAYAEKKETFFVTIVEKIYEPRSSLIFIHDLSQNKTLGGKPEKYLHKSQGFNTYYKCMIPKGNLYA